jgi:hypothetical protein
MSGERVTATSHSALKRSGFAGISAFYVLVALRERILFIFLSE